MNTVQPAKNLAQTIAKQMAREPVEILRQAGGQIMRSEGSGQNGEEETKNSENADSGGTLNEEEIKKKDLEKIRALEREINEIRRDGLYKELSGKIVRGEPVSLTDYTELVPEQKQVLMAQMEAVRRRNLTGSGNNRPLEQSSSKPSRRFLFGGGKLAARRQATKVEKPI
jgi:hypothetical protein